MLLHKSCVTLAIALCASIMCLAQDIIIKQDKTEIKSKVSEITETAIKYKKWENTDGPLYSISKTEVFMILYSNGQREIINQENKPLQQLQTTNPSAYRSNHSEVETNQTKNSNVDTTVDYKKLKVKYTPTRINIGLQQPLSIGSNCEFRIVKNIFNIGIAYDYLFPKDEYILSENFGFVYGSLYAPINRLAGNYEKQDKGLFVFAHAGYGITSSQIKDDNDKTSTTNAGGFTWRAGIDYYITKGFGVTVSSYKFKTAYAGFVFNL